MSITLRPAHERGHATYHWLESHHTFSFARYHDASQMGFRTLRVINQDRVQGGHGFPMHAHQEMEIISYVLEGQLQHTDTMGNRSTIGSGDVQVISGGTGFAHSEHNPSPTDPVHFLQIWIEPDPHQHGQPPSYSEGRYPSSERSGALRLIVSGDGRDGSVRIRQDADLYATRLAPADRVELPVRAGRGVWVHVASGRIDLNGHTLGPGDGAAIEDESLVRLTGADTAEVIVFDMP